MSNFIGNNFRFLLGNISSISLGHNFKCLYGGLILLVFYPETRIQSFLVFNLKIWVQIPKTFPKSHLFTLVLCLLGTLNVQITYLMSQIYEEIATRLDYN